MLEVIILEKKTKKCMAVAAILGGMGVAGYMYMKKNPDLLCQMKEMTKDVARKTYEKLEDME